MKMIMKIPLNSNNRRSSSFNEFRGIKDPAIVVPCSYSFVLGHHFSEGRLNQYRSDQYRSVRNWE